MGQQAAVEIRRASFGSGHRDSSPVVCTEVLLDLLLLLLVFAVVFVRDIQRVSVILDSFVYFQVIHTGLIHIFHGHVRFVRACESLSVVSLGQVFRTFRNFLEVQRNLFVRIGVDLHAFLTQTAGYVLVLSLVRSGHQEVTSLLRQRFLCFAVHPSRFSEMLEKVVCTIIGSDERHSLARFDHLCHFIIRFSINTLSS